MALWEVSTRTLVVLPLVYVNLVSKPNVHLLIHLLLREPGNLTQSTRKIFLKATQLTQQ